MLGTGTQLFTVTLAALVTLVAGERLSQVAIGNFHSDRNYNHRKRVLTVTTVLVEPFCMLRQNYDALFPRHDGIYGNSLYHGYMVDLMELIGSLVQVRYRLVPVWDGEFGFMDSDGTWNGMVGELIRGEADLAVGPLYITRRRARVIDFTRPFMDIRASVLVRRDSYAHAQTLDDLLQSNRDFKFGTLNRGMIFNAMRRSNDTRVAEVFQRMRSAPEFLTQNNAEGIHRVRNGSFGYVLPSNIADYVSRRKPCDLRVVTSRLLDAGFGLAAQRDSTLIPVLNGALRLLDARGDLRALYSKWWTDAGECDNSSTDETRSKMADKVGRDIYVLPLQPEEQSLLGRSSTAASHQVSCVLLVSLCLLSTWCCPDMG